MLGFTHRRSTIKDVILRIRSRLVSHINVHPAHVYIGYRSPSAVDTNLLSIFILHDDRSTEEEDNVYGGPQTNVVNVTGTIVVRTVAAHGPATTAIYDLYNPGAHMDAVEYVYSYIHLFWPYDELSSFSGGQVVKRAVTIIPIHVTGIIGPVLLEENRHAIESYIKWKTQILPVWYQNSIVDDIEKPGFLSGAQFIQNAIIDWKSA